MDPFLGEVRAFAATRMPEHGWLPCEGQLLRIREHPNLFTAIGLVYGGDGREWFAVPDLRGRAPAGADDLTQVNVLSGAAPVADDGGMLPYLVVTWAICTHGRHPAG